LIPARQYRSPIRLDGVKALSQAMPCLDNSVECSKTKSLKHGGETKI
jgi:hypothetical protein